MNTDRRDNDRQNTIDLVVVTMRRLHTHWHTLGQICARAPHDEHIRGVYAMQRNIGLCLIDMANWLADLDIITDEERENAYASYSTICP